MAAIVFPLIGTLANFTLCPPTIASISIFMKFRNLLCSITGRAVFMCPKFNVSRMLKIMHFTISTKHKIFNNIVKFVFVFMVNYFMLFKFATKMLLHNMAMLKNLFTINIDFSISRFMNRTILKMIMIRATKVFSGTFIRAKLSSFIVDLKNRIALFTGKCIHILYYSVALGRCQAIKGGDCHCS